MKNRSWVDIVSMILDETSEASLKTEIMLNVGLSYYQLQEYLQVCTKSNLLSYDKIAKTYRVTEKGRKFQELHYAINALLSKETIPLKINI